MKRAFDDEALGKKLSSGAMHYRAFIGSPEIYNLLSSSHFRLLTWFGSENTIMSLILVQDP